MDNPVVMPELKQILGAMIFGAERPLGVAEMRRCLAEVAEEQGGPFLVFAEARKGDVEAALAELRATIAAAKVGFHLGEVAGGYRLQSDVDCSPWLRHLLKMGRPQRLSRPALETLAIVAYRQPVAKAQIEAVRGVAVDHLIKALMELQLVRIVGRSDLPGKPFLYGTTQLFLEHFGLKNLDDLGAVEPMLMLRREQGPVRPRVAKGARLGSAALEDAEGDVGAEPAAEALPESSAEPAPTDEQAADGAWPISVTAQPLRPNDE